VFKCYANAVEYKKIKINKKREKFFHKIPCEVEKCQKMDMETTSNDIVGALF
jgi:hypothetical protein